MSLTFSILISDTHNLIISHFELNSLEKDNFVFYVMSIEMIKMVNIEFIQVKLKHYYQEY